MQVEPQGWQSEDTIERVLNHRSIPELIADLEFHDPEQRWFCFGQRKIHIPRCCNPNPKDLALYGVPWRFISAEHNSEHTPFLREEEMAITFDNGRKHTHHCRLLDSGLIVRHENDSATAQPRGWKELGFVVALTTGGQGKGSPPPTPEATVRRAVDAHAQVAADSAQALHDALRGDLPPMDEAGCMKPRAKFCFTNGDERGSLWTLLSIHSERYDPELNQRVHIGIRLDGESVGRSIAMDLRKGLLYPTPSCCALAPFATMSGGGCLGKSWAASGSRILRFPPSQESVKKYRPGQRIMVLSWGKCEKCHAGGGTTVKAVRLNRFGWCGDCEGTADDATLRGFIAAGQLYSAEDLVDVLRPYFSGLEYAKVVPGGHVATPGSRRRFHFFNEDGKKGHPWRLLHAHAVGKRLINLAICAVGADPIKSVELEMTLNDGLLHYTQTLRGTVSGDKPLITSFTTDHLIVPEPAEKDTTEIAKMANSSVSSIEDLVDALRPYFGAGDDATQFRFVDEDGKKGRPWCLRLARLVGERLNLSIHPLAPKAAGGYLVELEMTLVDGQLHYARTLQGIVCIPTSGLPIIVSPFDKGQLIELIVPEPAGTTCAEDDIEFDDDAVVGAEGGVKWKVQKILDHSSPPALTRDLRECETANRRLCFVKAPDSHNCPTVENALIDTTHAHWTPSTVWQPKSSPGERVRFPMTVTFADADGHHICQWFLHDDFGVVEVNRDGVNSQRALGFIAVLAKDEQEVPTVTTHDDAVHLYNRPPPNRPLCAVCNTVLYCEEEVRGNVCSRCTERTAATRSDALLAVREVSAIDIRKPWPRWIKVLALLAVMAVAYNADCVVEHAKEHAPAWWSWTQSVAPEVKCEVCGEFFGTVAAASTRCYPLSGPPAEGGRSPAPVEEVPVDFSSP